jgi:hypothetical protein
MTIQTRMGGAGIITMDKPLDNDQLFRLAPSIFAVEKHESRSERYTYIPTIEVVEGLRKEGFFPFAVAQGKSRIEGKAEFTKHLMRFRKLDGITRTESNEIVLINSHDGTSSYRMLSGIIRHICSNGMITGDIVEDIRVLHKGNIVDNVVNGAFRIMDEFDLANESMERMKQIPMSVKEQEIFAKASLALKYDKDEIEEGQWRESSAPILPAQLLAVKRQEDRSSDLWTKFNVVQENLIRGGQHGRSASGRRATTRAVNSIDGNVKLNKALWILADEMARIKAS